jgi:uncharacterized radical SAM superfamily protein
MMKYIEANMKFVDIVTTGVVNEYYCKMCSQKLLEIKMITGTTFDEYKEQSNEFISEHNKNVNNIIN